ncbi:hypothetical protein BDF20DRAFT_150110 [Mycotypha africana]|uniref:uncharacterized protein n=1 Tax=Mycotypha africana TaxID=64632 RepID=UPI0023010203|nr:uncharacterized protein BDF20DRAFT_150110 [Mycotypha africana]KAI8969191.1 hypothetical protein BDF20DRAFT_150110 [Mycotypha africana]
MHKLKHVFQRSQKSQTEENRRSQQFVKRHSAIATTTLNRSASIIATATTRSHKHQDNISNIDNWLTTSPSIDGAELSDNERKTYESWWKDFDPFDLGKVSNHALFKFLNGCSLPDEKLEQILALFKTSSIEEHGLDRLQFFALLRLVAHAQNGRKVSRALVYLGAPIPRCNIKPCNTLRMEDVFKHHSSQKSFYFDNGEKGQDDNYKNHIFDVIPNNTIVSQCEEHQKRPINRQSWWSITNSSGSFSSSNGFINNKPSLQQNGNRRSYNGPYTTNTSIPNNAHFSPNLLPHDTNTTTFITTTSNNTLISSPIVNATDNNSSTLQMMDYFNTLAPLSDNSTSKTKLLSPPITYQQQEMLPWTQTDMSEINDLEAKQRQKKL